MKKGILFLMVALLCGGIAAAQSNGGNTISVGDEIYTVVEQDPEFPGGMDAMIAWLGSNVQYPAKARQDGLQGTVYVTFVVERNGAITGVKVVNHDEKKTDLEEEAMRAVRSMPKWKPGKARGEKVRVQFTLPIKFSL